METDDSNHADPSVAAKQGQSPGRRRAGLFELGATSIEYGIIAGLLSLALYVGSQVAGNGLNKVFAVIGVAVQNATNTAEQNSGN